MQYLSFKTILYVCTHRVRWGRAVCKLEFYAQSTSVLISGLGWGERSKEQFVTIQGGKSMRPNFSSGVAREMTGGRF